MRIGLISDTHLPSLMRHLDELGPQIGEFLSDVDLILHGGDVVAAAALDQLRAATGAAGCEDAVAVLHGRMPAGAQVTVPDRRPDPEVAVGATTTVDACRSAWGAAAPQLGRVVLTRTTPSTFQVSSFTLC